MADNDNDDKPAAPIELPADLRDSIDALAARDGKPAAEPVNGDAVGLEVIEQPARDAVDNIERCGNCLYYLELPAQAGSVCRRHPPTMILLGMVRNMAGKDVPVTKQFWPWVVAGEWCGEFKWRDEPVRN